MTTTIPDITELSTPPSRSDPDNFVSRSDTFFGELPTLGTEINAMVTATNTVSGEVSANATAATSSAVAATAAATAVQSASNATAYDTGKTGGYLIGNVVYSTSGFSYRCIQDQAEGAVGAVTNTAYWTQLGGLQDGQALNMEDQLLIRPKIKDYSEVFVPYGTFSGGQVNLYLLNGNIISATISTAEHTFVFIDGPPSGANSSLTFFITNGGSQVINWPSSVNWVGGIPPTLTATGTDVLVFTTNNGSAIWYGFVAGLDVK